LGELQSLHGPQSDFIAKLADFYLTRSERSGYQGAAMYDPLAVGVAIDPTLVTLKDMHVEVEMKGEFTRGETVANRMGSNENNVLHGGSLRDRGRDRSETERASLSGVRRRPISAAIHQPHQREIDRAFRDQPFARATNKIASP
jgi:hypothetical protein